MTMTMIDEKTQLLPNLFDLFLFSDSASAVDVLCWNYLSMKPKKSNYLSSIVDCDAKFGFVLFSPQNLCMFWFNVCEIEWEHGHLVVIIFLSRWTFPLRLEVRIGKHWWKRQRECEWSAERDKLIVSHVWLLKVKIYVWICQAFHLFLFCCCLCCCWVVLSALVFSSTFGCCCYQEGEGDCDCYRWNVKSKVTSVTLNVRVWKAAKMVKRWRSGVWG